MKSLLYLRTVTSPHWENRSRGKSCWTISIRFSSLIKIIVISEYDGSGESKIPLRNLTDGFWNVLLLPYENPANKKFQLKGMTVGSVVLNNKATKANTAALAAIRKVFGGR